MDFELTDDQILLRISLQTLFAKEYSFAQRQQLLRTPFGHSPEVWKLLADQGVLGVGLPETQGGFGGPVETMIVMEEIGRALVLEPYMSSVALCGGLIANLGTQEQRQDYLPRIIAGDCRAALAHHEADARYTLEHVRTSLGGWVLNGTKTVIQDGAMADSVIVSARDDEAGGLSLLLLDSSLPGLEWIRYRTHDGRSAADLICKDVRVTEQHVLGVRGVGLEGAQMAVDTAIAASCAEAVGAMEALNAATLEHLKTRRQFGQVIGRFQVLQHRMADMFLYATQARSMSFLATGRCQDRDPVERRRALSAAKAFIGKAARFVGQEAVQLHGGMGLSAELSVSHYFKRLTLINASWGDVDHHVGIVGNLLLAEESA